MSAGAYSVIALAVLLAACMQASIGFGMGMLAAPIVALVDPSLIPATLIMLAFVVTVLVTLREREHIDLAGTGWAMVGRVPGSIAGALLVAALPERGLSLVLAGVVLIGVVLATLGWAPEPSRTNLVLAGGASGVLGTATSIGGPPMAMVWQRTSGARLRGTMSTFFLVGSSISLVALAVTGSINGHTIRVFALLVPAAILGYVLSRYVNTLLDPKRLRWTAIGVSTFGAVVLIGQQLFAA